MENTRHRRLEELLNASGDCSVRRLADECGVSEMTIRRDLAVLARAGRVIRTHGGAAPAGQVVFEFTFLQRVKVNEEAKQRIATAAAAMVQDGQTLLMDSGTTTLALAKELRCRSHLTVITTSLPIASALQHAPGVGVLLLGGYVRRGSPDLSGVLTEQNLENLQADLAFIGADGIDLRGDIYNESLEAGRMLGKMAARAHAAYVVADSSKIGKRALMRFGNIARWQGLITDAAIKRHELVALRRAGVNVRVAGSAA